MDKKVLIITYYWPPSGGSGVQRWLKFVKYLPAFGWKPFVFTPENPSFETKDESLLRDVPPEAEIIRIPIWEPYSLFNLFSGKKNGSTSFVPGSKASFLKKVSIWIRGNFFIPDPRIFWVRPSVKFLTKYLRDNQINTIITTGPPHSMHLIGLKLKQRNPSLNWLADFRDPWSEWGFLDSLKVGAMARGIHKKLERKVLAAADIVITITPFYVEHFSRLSGRKVNLLTNGFDEDDFTNFVVQKNKRFLIRHVGIVNEKCDPRPFMNAVAELCQQDNEIKNLLGVEFVGAVHPAFKEFVVSNKILSSVTQFTAPVPHKELKGIYASSAVLVLILTGYKDAEGYAPGKLFEYLATGLPIVGVGPVRGDGAAILNSTQAGLMFDNSDIAGVKNELLRLFQAWKSDSMVSKKGSAALYSRKAITQQLTMLLR